MAELTITIAMDRCVTNIENNSIKHNYMPFFLVFLYDTSVHAIFSYCAHTQKKEIDLLWIMHVLCICSCDVTLCQMTYQLRSM